MNHSDCGLFVLKYIEKFLVDGDTATRELLANRYDRWFPNEEVEGMRQQMQGIIETLQVRYERHRQSVAAAAAAAGPADTSSDVAAVDSAAGDDTTASAAAAADSPADMAADPVDDAGSGSVEPDAAARASAADSVSEVVTQQDMEIVS